MGQDADALSVHVAFFDVNRDGAITRAEIATAMRELGFSPAVATLVSPLLAMALPSDIAQAAKLRHADSGALDSRGAFDEEAFLRWFKEADRDSSGTLSRLELLRSSLHIADDPVSLVASLGELQLVHLLLAEDDGLHRSAVEGFLSGELFRALIRKREEGGISQG